MIPPRSPVVARGLFHLADLLDRAGQFLRVGGPVLAELGCVHEHHRYARAFDHPIDLLVGCGGLGRGSQFLDHRLGCSGGNE